MHYAFSKQTINVAPWWFSGRLYGCGAIKRGRPPFRMQIFKEQEEDGDLEEMDYISE